MVAGVSATDVGRVLAGYEAVKRERCVIDLDDILLCAVGLLVQHRDITEEIRARYRHFVVDEYQDVSPLQHRLLELWFGDRNDVCVVGDPHQAIHSYAGARADYLLDFVADHPGAKRIDLVRNYRSTPEIVQLANEVLVNRMTQRRLWNMAGESHWFRGVDPVPSPSIKLSGTMPPKLQL